MADKVVTIAAPVLANLNIILRAAADGTPTAIVTYPAHPWPNAVEIRAADLTAAERAAGVTFVAGLITAAKTKLGGF